MDISCTHCAMTIKRALAEVKGISAVDVDVPAKAVTFAYADDDALARAKAALEEAGYPAEEA
ncbi:MAG: heavy-metal-associated domain-containing protein [Anaerolineae bacterium]